MAKTFFLDRKMFKNNKKKKIEAETCPPFRVQYFKVRKKY